MSVATLPSRPTRYSSASITERRRRILMETRVMIGAGGIDAFTLRDLARQAGVSVSTLYNIFGDREALIAHALRDYYAELTFDLAPGLADLATYCATLDETTRLIRSNAAYSIALADLFFSRSLAPALFDIVQGFALAPFTPWLEAADAARALRPGADHAEAAALLANLEWSAVRDWGAARLVDDALGARRKRVFLLVVSAIAAPELRDQANELIAELDASA